MRRADVNDTQWVKLQGTGKLWQANGLNKNIEVCTVIQFDFNLNVESRPQYKSNLYIAYKGLKLIFTLFFNVYKIYGFH